MTSSPIGPTGAAIDRPISNDWANSRAASGMPSLSPAAPKGLETGDDHAPSALPDCEYNPCHLSRLAH